MRPTLATRTLFGCAGTVLLIAAVWSALSLRVFLTQAARADGTVVALGAGGSHPVIEFKTADALVIRFGGHGLIFGFKPGDRVAVLYKRDNPQRSATLDAFGAIWFWPILLGALGTAFVLVIFASERR